MKHTRQMGVGSKGCAVLALLVIASAGYAQQIARPSLGVLFDARSGDIRTLVGIPGSAGIGEPLEIGLKLRSAAVCSEAGFALGVGQSDGAVLLISFGGGTLATAPLAGARNAPDEVLLSPSCTAAALVYRSVSQAQIVTGLPNHPSLSPVDLSVLQSAPLAAAVDDLGTALLIATSSEGSAAVERLTRNSSPALVLSTTSVSALEFLHNSADLLVADPVKNELLRVRNAASGPPTPSLAGTRAEGIADAVFVAVSSDNRYALIANPGVHSVAVLDLESQSGKQVMCSGDLVRITPLKGKFIFQLSDRVDRPITLLDIGGAAPRVTMIPAEPLAAGN